MTNYLSLLYRPFKYDSTMWGIFVAMMLFLIVFGGTNVGITIVSCIVAGIIVVFTSHIRPAKFKVMAPVLYVFTCLLLLSVMLLPIEADGTYWMRIGNIVIEPSWLVGLSIVLVVPMLYSNKNMLLQQREFYICLALLIILALLATQNIINAILLSFGISIALYVCNFSKRKIGFIIGFIVIGFLLASSVVMLFGKTKLEMKGYQDNRPQICYRIDNLKQDIINVYSSKIKTSQQTSLAMEESHNIKRSCYSHIQQNYSFALLFIPVLLCTFVTVRTTRKIKKCQSNYVKLLGIGAAYVLFASAISDVAITVLSLHGCSSIYVDSLLYGIIISCVGHATRKEIEK